MARIEIPIIINFATPPRARTMIGIMHLSHFESESFFIIDAVAIEIYTPAARSPAVRFSSFVSLFFGC
jgi:hypothetical protein